MNGEESAVLEALQTIRPAMEADGGGVELVSVREGIVRVRFLGACLRCPSIGMTMDLGIAGTLKQKLPWIKEVRREQ
jgi:Fe-S cluster biogenesis protein NfuA